MLDDEARRALEQEAIALVNLSNSQPLARAPQPSAAVAATAPKHGPVHPLLQQTKATLMARRDDRRAPHPHRGHAAVHFRPPSSATSSAPERRLSMSVFVTADGQMSSAASPYGALELSPAGLKHDKSASPTSTTMTVPATHHGDAHFSMQSLLVNLKKRKPEDDSTVAPTKLPRFRDVFEPMRPEQRTQLPTIKMQATPTVSYATVPVSPPPSAHTDSQQEDAPPMVEDSPYPPPPELKCKYRTGKCGNQRALKSCGDYHNLCNYHRLRANANQRKLDRKKKVQRGQPTATANGSSSEATSPVAAAPKLLAAPTVSAAASTLASLPSSFLLPRATQPSHTGTPSGHGTAPFLSYLVPPPSSSSSSSTSLLPSKSETKSC